MLCMSWVCLKPASTAGTLKLLYRVRLTSVGAETGLHYEWQIFLHVDFVLTKIYSCLKVYLNLHLFL